MRINVMGVEFDNLTKSEFVQRAERMLQSQARGYCVTPNAEIVYEAVYDPAYREALNGADLVLPDGAGVVLGSEILGSPLKEKVAGIEFGEEICRILAKSGGRLYLYGSKPGVAQLAGQRLTAQYPGLTICGTCDGYAADEQAVALRIKATAPDVVFVCTGFPRQEEFMAAYHDIIGAKLMLGLGGSLDCYAGVEKRAPRWMIDSKLEWFYRLTREPWRFKRMMRLPKFIGLCEREKRRRMRNG